MTSGGLTVPESVLSGQPPCSLILRQHGVSKSGPPNLGRARAQLCWRDPDPAKLPPGGVP